MKQIIEAVLLLLIYTLPSFAGQLIQEDHNDDGYLIQFRLKNMKNDTIILGQRFNQSYIRKDTALLDESGKGEFRGNTPLPQGMYLVYLPDNRFFDLLIGEDQHFTFENDTSDMLTYMKLSGSVENEAFYDYQLFLKNKREEAVALQEKIKSTDNEADSIVYSTELSTLNDEVQGYTDKVIADNKGTFLSVFLQALQDVEVPDPPRDENGVITDSLFQYRYFKQHYFDNFDISDVRLLRTPLYENKIMTYIDKVVIQIPDTLIREVDMLISKSRTDEQLFRYMLITLFNHYAQSQIMGMDALYVHLAENYYIPEATWSDKEFITKLKDRVAKLKPLLLGKVAPDIQLVRISLDHIIQANEDEELKKNPYVGEFFQLHAIKAPYVILYFWEVDCGHCKKQTPMLYEAYQRLKSRGVEVVAVHILGGEEGKVKWINEINNKGYHDWINAWNPYDFQYKILYDISATPALFVMDENMKIVAKRIDPEQAEKIISALLDSKKKE
jgi:thiol-disulfide isomerase/thioredoxin